VPPQIHVQPEEFNFRKLGRVLSMRLRLLEVCLAAGLALSLLYLARTPAVYEATSTLRLLDQDAADAVLAEEKQGAGTPQGGRSYQTELEMARSAFVASRVLQKLDLLARPEYVHATQDQVVEDLRRSVQVRNFKDSSLLALSAQSSDPQMAADLANSWGQCFIEACQDLKRRSASLRGTFIAGELQKMRSRLGSEAEPTEAGVGRPDLDPVEQLKLKITELEVDRAALARRYAPEHPTLKQTDAELAELRSQLAREAHRLPSRKSKVDEGVYALLLQRQEEAKIAENADDSGVLVIDQATPPRVPIKPNRGQVVALGAFAGLLLGAGLALGLDAAKDSVANEEDLSSHAGVPSLGIVPDFRAEKIRAHGRRLRNNHLISNDYFFNSFYRESFKILRTALSFKNPDGRLQALAVLSPSAAEGKSTVNANLAVALAQSGKRVLLVDADLRKPSLHRLFRFKPHARQGLPLLLMGQGDLKRMVLASTEVDNLYLLPNGYAAANPAELMGSARLDQLLAEWKKDYDYVVFDAAPLLAVTDSVLLASRLSGVFLMARAYATGKTELRRAADSLRAAQANLLGAVLNGVNLRKSGYGYAYRHYHQDGPKRPPSAPPKQV
jgi:tyrosine-protein kinase Etk/Wzc